MEPLNPLRLVASGAVLLASTSRRSTCLIPIGSLTPQRVRVNSVFVSQAFAQLGPIKQILQYAK